MVKRYDRNQNRDIAGMGPPELPLKPLPLDYAHHPSPHPKPLYDRVGLHFGAGLGPVSIVALWMMLMSPFLGWWTHRPTLIPEVLFGCGGVQIIVVQVGLFMLAAGIRSKLIRQYLEERNGWLTFLAGALSGVLVYGIPWISEWWLLSDLAAWIVVLAPLVLIPVIFQFFLLRPSTRS
jgi:hypothetical protein